MSHNALSADLQILIWKLKSGTRTSKKTLAMQRDLVSIFHEINVCYALYYWYGEEERSVLCTPRHAHSIVCYALHCWCWGRRVSGLYITATCTFYSYGSYTPIPRELRSIFGRGGKRSTA